MKYALVLPTGSFFRLQTKKLIPKNALTPLSSSTAFRTVSKEMNMRCGKGL
jgi:hypothetical protein